MTSKPRYQKLNQIDHVLKRSDMYCGSSKPKNSEEYIAVTCDTQIGFKIIKKKIKFAPALLRIFIEPLSNALDNVERSKNTDNKCTKISIKIDKDSGLTSVWNDGDFIPIEINDEGIYNHTMIFGHLLSGSNFDDDKERLMSGKNGCGSKISNIFSKSFKVTGVDPTCGKIFHQEWSNNMKITSEPTIKNSKLKKSYTEVSWIPDFSQFDIECYDDDIISLYIKYIIDASMLCGVKVFFNDKQINIKNLADYSKLYENITDEKIHIKNKTSEMLLTPCEDFQAISFVNGICTKQGGQHVDAWCEAIFRPLLEKFNKKGKPSLNITNIKQYFRIFVVATVDKPIFSSQEKEKLESPIIDASIKPSQINSIMKWSVGETIQDLIKSKEMIVLKKSEKKSRGYTKIEGLDPANFAGTKYSSDCSLILCEGLSAKTYAVAGIEKGVYEKKGRNYYGIYALKGKCLAPNTPIPLFNGNIKQAKDIVFGDVLINENGEPTNVLELFSGEDDMYEIQQERGNNYVVNSEHILTLKIYNGVYVDIPIKEYIELSDSDKALFNDVKLYTYVKWGKKEVEIDPYLIGLRIGNNDDSVEHLFNLIKDDIPKDDIPKDYIINDKDTRLKLLAGVIDVNSNIDENGKIEIVYSESRINILHSLLYLCRSLGFYCNLSKNKLTIYNNGLLKIPTKIKKITHDFINDNLNSRITVVKKGYGKYNGFMTDKTHRFILEDFTVTHNCLNCRNASPTMIANNNEITGVIKALGLKHEVDYTIEDNFKQLNYGKVILMTDADVDGLHITSLIMNFFHYLFPSILKRKEPFLISLNTPIVRIFKKPKDILFYDERKFLEYAFKQTSKFEKKYYKGLGTTRPEDVSDTFGSKIVEYTMDNKTDVNMNKVFHKKYADDRKKWLAEYDPNNYFSLDDGGQIMNMSLSDFIDGEMIKFSIDDCSRNIPNLIDGQKISQRKVLYAVKKKNLKYSGKSLKVAQLGGYVAEKTNYHHGEQNLYDTIVKMANEYVGSNNIPLLYRDGMFSTRLNGKDAASARYIYTKMDILTHLIFRQEDDVLLNYVIDDGDSVEPKFYVPIIPMILVNGCICGLGTGWSSNIPNYNPIDLITCIKIWIENDGNIFTETETSISSLLPEITPWYRGFKGIIEKNSDNRFISKGIITNGLKSDKYISELPIGMWTDKFKENMEELLENKKIKSIKNFSTPKIVNFVITPITDGIELDLETLKLHSYIYTSNMVLFTEKEKIKKYDNVHEIINDFCKVRLQYYFKRKNYQINQLENDIKFLENKQKFISEVMDNTLHIMNIPEDDIIKQLETRGYDKLNSTDDDTDDTGEYNYLLKLQIRTFSKNKIQKLKDEINLKKSDLDIIKNTPEKQLWLNDLEEFQIEYEKFLKIMENVETKLPSKKYKK